MIRYDSEVSIEKPPDMVYPWIVELDKQGQWSDVQMRLLTPAPLSTGSQMQLTFGRPPLRAIARAPGRSPRGRPPVRMDHRGQGPDLVGRRVPSRARR